MVSAASKQEPKFPWDIDIPATRFWNDINHVAPAFLACFPDKNDVAHMKLDDYQDLDNIQKLRHLRTVLDDTLAAREAAVAPRSLRDVDSKTYKGLRSAQATISSSIGDYASAETIFMELRGDDHGYGLAHLWLTMGKYAEAEGAAREALPWIREQLGTPDSPQTLGLLRGVLVPAVWKQGKVEEAREWVRETEEVIGRMATGKFAKYEGEEREELARVVGLLEEGL